MDNFREFLKASIDGVMDKLSPAIQVCIAEARRELEPVLHDSLENCKRLITEKLGPLNLDNIKIEVLTCLLKILKTIDRPKKIAMAPEQERVDQIVVSPSSEGSGGLSDNVTCNNPTAGSGSRLPVVGAPDEKRPLKMFVEKMQYLARIAESSSEGILLEDFAQACILMVEVLKKLGPDFSIGYDVTRSMAENLMKAAKPSVTVGSMLDEDCKVSCAKEADSYTRQVLRLMRTMNFLSTFSQEFLTQGMQDMIKPAIRAYIQVFRGYHEEHLEVSAIEKLNALPEVEHLIAEWHEEYESTEILLTNFISATKVVKGNVEGLFISKGLGIDW